jgi:multiple sugar transport system substrate-binding protein
MARKRVLLGSVSLFVLIAAVIGSQAGAADRKGSANTITYWSRGANEAINKTLVDAWNASHAQQVQLLAVPDAEYETKLAAAVAAGTPPDVATVDVAVVPKLIQGGALANITSQAKALPFYNKLAKGFINYATVGGKLYAVPVDIDASTLFWNKDLFRRAGIGANNPPRNFKEILADAKKISKLGHGIYGFYMAGGCGGCNAYTFLPLVWAGGGDFVSKDGKKSTLSNNPALTASLQLYHNLWVSHNVPASAKSDTGAGWVSTFGSGKIGMELLGAFAVGPTHASKVNFGVTTIPGYKGGASAYTGGDVAVIPNKSSNADGAWQFIAWALSPAAQVDVYAKAGRLTARSDLGKNQYSAKDAGVLGEQKAATVGRTPIYYPQADAVNAPTGPYFTAWQRIIFNGANIPKTLKDADKAIDALLARG